MRNIVSNHVPAIGVLRVLIMMTLLVMVQSSFARIQNSGEMLTLEMQLAPYLAAGGSLGDLCEDGELYCPGCAECDMCCTQLPAALPSSKMSVERWLRIDTLQRIRPVDAATPPSRAPPGPPVRAPPILV